MTLRGWSSSRVRSHGFGLRGMDEGGKLEEEVLKRETLRWTREGEDRNRGTGDCR